MTGIFFPQTRMSVLFHCRLLALTTTVLLLSLAPVFTPIAKRYLEVQIAAQTLDNRKTEADQLFKLAEQQLLANQLSDAQQNFLKVLEIRRALRDEAGIAQTLNRVGEVNLNLRKFDWARTALEEALSIWRNLGQQLGEAEALTYLGANQRIQQQYQLALPFYQQALSLQQTLKDPIGIARTQLEMGAMAIEQGDAARGLKQLQEGLSALKVIEKDSRSYSSQRLQQGRLLSWMGLALLNLQQPQVAEQTLDQALAITRETGDRRIEGLTLFFKGLWYSNQKQSDAALERFQQALAIYEPSGDQSSVAYLHYFIGLSHFNSKQYPAAIAAFQKALLIHREAGNQKEQAQVLSNLGETYNSLNQHQAAIEAFQQASKIYQTLKDQVSEVRMASSIAQTYGLQTSFLLQQGKTAEALIARQNAIEQFQKAYHLSQQLQNPLIENSLLLAVGQATLSQGQDLAHAGEYSLALNALHKAVESLTQGGDQARTLNNAQQQKTSILGLWTAYSAQGTTYEALKQYPESLKAAQQSLAIVQKERAALESELAVSLELNSLAQIGLQYNTLGQNAKSLESYRQALELNRQFGRDPSWEVRILRAIAGIYENLSQYPQALETTQQALNVAQNQLKDPEEVAGILALSGIIYDRLGQYSSAIAAYEQGLAIARKMGNRTQELTFLNNLGSVYVGQGRYLQALTYREEVLKQSEQMIRRIEAKDPKVIQEYCFKNIETSRESTSDWGFCTKIAKIGYETALNNIGQLYKLLGRYAEAATYHQRSLQLTQELGDRSREAISLNNSGTLSLRTGDYSQALNYFQEALKIQIELENRSGQSVVLSNLGGLYQEQGQYAKALDYRQQALKISQEIGARNQESILLNSIGMIYDIQGEPQRALEAYQKALEIDRSLGAVSVPQLNNIAQFYQKRGEIAKAQEYYQQALTGAQKNGDRVNETVVLVNLSDIAWSEGRYAESLNQQQKALEIYREMGDLSSEAITLFRLGWSYRILGQYEQAMGLLQQSLKLSRQMGIRPQEAVTLNQIGVIEREQKRYAEALENHQKALAMQRAMGELQTAIGTLVNIGFVQIQRGEFAQAEAAFQEAAQLQDKQERRSSLPTILRGLGLVAAGQGKLPQAIAQLKQAQKIHQAVGDREEESITLTALGELLLQNQQPQEAEEVLNRAIELLNLVRSGFNNQQLREQLVRQNVVSLSDTEVSLFDTQIKTYRLLQQALIAQNKTEAALEISEQGRARVFVDSLTRGLAGTESKSTIQSESINLAKIRNIARSQNATLVSYSVVSSEQLLIWVVQPNGQLGFKQVDLTPLLKEGKNLDKLIALARCFGNPVCERGIAVQRVSSRGFLDSGSSIVFNLERSERAVVPVSSPKNPYLQQLHQFLIQPIAEYLPANPDEQVIFIPQGSLFLVPFAALQDSKEQYLVEQHTLRVSPSIQVLELTQQQQKKARQVGLKDVLVVGNPKMPQVKIGSSSFQLASLPGAEEEAKVIASLMGTKALIGNQATEVTVIERMKQSRFIHLATHGQADDQQGLQSWIALAPSEKADGLLTANEILKLKLGAELVVLSACQTGQGRITGDGVIGLSRSFFLAGVPSVLVSLWEVPDAPTSALMKAFYEALKQNPDRAKSLRQAMLETKKSYPDPLNWAAFLLLGETI